jgi:hypothetical protein
MRALVQVTSVVIVVVDDDELTVLVVLVGTKHRARLYHLSADGTNYCANWLLTQLN